jgi:two-component sensor histidine kinase
MERFGSEQDDLHGQQVVTAELQHRMRNLIGVVQLMAQRTIKECESLESFHESFRTRLSALAQVNDLMSSRKSRNGVTFNDLLTAELTAHGLVGAGKPGSQISLSGPEGVRLPPSAVQILALALHELATNAIKHGALSDPAGRLAVSWSTVPSEGGPSRFRLEWRETGGPQHVVCDRKGYGRELIERAIPYQLQAETSYQLTSDGLLCVVTLPIDPT